MGKNRLVAQQSHAVFSSDGRGVSAASRVLANPELSACYYPSKDGWYVAVNVMPCMVLTPEFRINADVSMYEVRRRLFP